MKTVTFSGLRNNAKKFFDAVEKGEQIEVYRHGKPIAIISPARAASNRWQNASPLSLNGVSLSQIIVASRKESK
ncbi:MAG: type II toxin-antitoxin system prevent-host-death family antitoxin [Deltaproteobacteria bacterium]|nr:type II toxin-antitoxin system prevent-host-death family antitoxin [Deltaproteobacteria bacterium]